MVLNHQAMLVHNMAWSKIGEFFFQNFGAKIQQNMFSKPPPA